MVEDLWVSLYKRDFVELEDVLGIQLWMQALSAVGYRLLKRSVKSKSAQNSFVALEKINVNIGSSILKVVSGTPQNCLKMQANKTFFSIDLHDGTRADIASQLSYLGKTILLSGIKGRQSPYPEVLKMPLVNIHKSLSPVIKSYVHHSSSVSNDEIAANVAFYSNDETVKKVNAFVCSFPASICELWMPFNKSIVFLPAHRYNLGRCFQPEFQRLNDKLKALSSRPGNVVGAMSRYDLEYLNYYLDLQSNSRLISSLSGVYTMGNEYSPTRKEIPVITTVPKHFTNSLRYIGLVPLRELYGHYQLSNLVSHPAIVFLPYSVMSYKLTEFYSLGIPLFFPSPKYFLNHGSLGDDRTSSTPPYCLADARLNELMHKHSDSAYPYSPNADFDISPEAEMYWLQFSDFYDWPFIEYFDDVQDLEQKLKVANLTRMHLGMRRAYEARQFRTFQQWCELISKLG